MLDWFYSSGIAAQLTRAVADAAHRPQKISLTMYLNDERAVLTDIAKQAWEGEFPDGALRGPSGAANQAPAIPGEQAQSQQHPQVPDLRVLLRGSMAPPMHTIQHRRRRSTDGYIWPTWRRFGS